MQTGRSWMTQKVKTVSNPFNPWNPLFSQFPFLSGVGVQGGDVLDAAVGGGADGGEDGEERGLLASVLLAVVRAVVADGEGVAAEWCLL